MIDQSNLELQKDRQLVEWATDHILWKLATSRVNGRHGWWDQNVCSIEGLEEHAMKHINRGRSQYLDAAILLLMAAYVIDEVEGKDD